MAKVGSSGVDVVRTPEGSAFESCGRPSPIEMKVFNSDNNFKDWSVGSNKVPTRPRAKSYSSFGRLTSFMAGSPRLPTKYYCSNSRSSRAAPPPQKSTKAQPDSAAEATKTSLLIMHRKTPSAGSGGGRDLEPKSSTTEATMEAARLALAARAEYSKRRNSKCLEKAAFYIVMDEKVKKDLVGRKVSPSQLEDIGSLLLEEAQRCDKIKNGEDIRSTSDRSRLTPMTLQSLQSASRSHSRASKSRKKDPGKHSSRHHKKSRPSVGSRSSDGFLTPTGSTPTRSSPGPDSLAGDDVSISADQLMSTTMTTTASDDNEDVFDVESTAQTTASTTANTPEDVLSTPGGLLNGSNSPLLPGEDGEKHYGPSVEAIAQLKREDRQQQSRRQSSSQSSSSSFYERQREALLKLNGLTSSNKVKTSSVNRLSSTVSSVFGRQGSSAMMNPFPPENPITTTSANSKPVSPLSLVIAGIVMLSGTCAFLLSFALGRHGSWTLAASVVMGVGAILVFSGLCWYLAHTSAPSAHTKIRFCDAGGRLTTLTDVEIKVVDRQQLDKLIKQGACVETVNTVAVA